MEIFGRFVRFGRCRLLKTFIMQFQVIGSNGQSSANSVTTSSREKRISSQNVRVRAKTANGRSRNHRRPFRENNGRSFTEYFKHLKKHQAITKRDGHRPKTEEPRLTAAAVTASKPTTAVAPTIRRGTTSTMARPPSASRNVKHNNNNNNNNNSSSSSNNIKKEKQQQQHQQQQ